MKKRESSVELLRIIAMIMIVMHHYSVHSGIDWAEMSNYFNRYLLSVIQLGEWAVNIFILIYGYFSVTSQFNIKRIIRLYAQVWFYSAVLFAAYTLWNRELHIGFALRAVTPIISDQYWFFSKYILLCMLMPFINTLIQNMSREKHRMLIALLTFVWCILSSILPRFFEYALGTGAMGAFVLLYFIGAYMRLYPDSRICTAKWGSMAAVGSLAVMMLYQLVQSMYKIPFLYLDCYSNSSILSVCFAVGMLAVFTNMKLKPNKFINGIAACTFGVYLIHDNDYVRPFLWHYLLKNSEYQSSPYMIVHMLISVISAFIICTIIEFIRKQTIGRLLEKWIGSR